MKVTRKWPLERQGCALESRWQVRLTEGRWAVARSNRFDDYGDVLTLSDVSALLGCHLETARLWARRGELPARKVGRSYLVLKKDLIGWLEAQPRTDQPKGAKTKRA